MKRFYTIILALGLMAATAVAQVTHHEVRVGDFTQLVVIDDINVIYRCVPDSAGLAVADCSQAVADGLIFARTGSGRLSIQLSNEVARMRQLPVLTVYSSTLTEAENAGDSTLLVTPIGTRAEKFKVRLSDNGKVISHGLDAQQLELCILTGKGKIIADGQCDKLHAKLIGTGEIQADQVTATDVDCHIMGTGTIGCMVNGGNLNVRGGGTGKVYYKGTPAKVSVRKLGSIKAIPMP